MRVAIRLAAALAALTAIAGGAAAQPAIDDSLVVPFVTEVGQSAFKQYRLAPAPKAFVVSASGIAVWRQEETLELSLQRAGEVCARIARLPCRAYAENDAVVWDGPVTIAAQQEFARGHNVAAQLSGARFAQEATDRKVAPVADPARAPVHGATPTALPGGAVITTGALRTALHGEAPPLLIDVSSSRGERIGTIPGAIWLDKAGLGRWRAGDDAAEARAFRAAMARIAPNLETPLVFTCDSANCWQAYRAALRAISLGHTDVAWYRGGVLSGSRQAWRWRRRRCSRASTTPRRRTRWSSARSQRCAPQRRQHASVRLQRSSAGARIWSPRMIASRSSIARPIASPRCWRPAACSAPTSPG
jgi:rhodanese-related sulfurtransferase